MMKRIIITTLMEANQYSDSPVQSQACQANTTWADRTVEPNMYQLHQEYRNDNHEGPLPRLHLRRPKLHAISH